MTLSGSGDDAFSSYFSHNNQLILYLIMSVVPLLVSEPIGSSGDYHVLFN